MSNNQQITDVISQTKVQINTDIASFLACIDLPDNLKQAVQYATLNGGKRVRPALVYTAYHTCNDSKNCLNDDARRCAMAVELLHCYSLVHDDLPCMDDDELRRGVPTCHIAHGEAVALLAGDVLQTLAFEALTSEIAGFKPSHITSPLLAIFAPRARRMVAGQMRDLNAENKANGISQIQLEKIHTDKTGALIEASVLMGAMCAKATDAQTQALHIFAKKIGLAFQVQDDILDITATTEQLGKPSGSDEKLDKATYPKLMGLEQAQLYANQLFDEATQSLQAEFSNESPLSHFAEWLWARKK